MCPFAKGGKVGLFGGAGVGKTVNMLKEIHEQPRAIAQTLEERVAGGKLLEAAFGPLATEVFRRTEAVQIVACGTSYHAGMSAI